MLFLGGELRRARAHLERGEAAITACPVRVANHAGAARDWFLMVLYGLGEWREYLRRMGVFLADAHARGDRFAELNLSLGSYLAELMADRPEAAREAIDRVGRLWPRADASRELLWGYLAATVLYRDAGVGDGALELLRDSGRNLARWFSVRLSGERGTYVHHVHGSIHLAAAATATRSRRAVLLREVDRDAAALDHMPTRAAPAYAAYLRAGAAAGRGDRAGAGALLAAAEGRFAALDMALCAAAALRRRGELMGGVEGRALVAAADAALSAQDIVNPARMVASLLPGRW